MTHRDSYHSICRWTFHSGKGGFQPGNIRPKWGGSDFDTVSVIQIIKSQIAPKLPSFIKLGFEVHYDTEVNDRTAGAIADALVDAKLNLAMITPGAHSHYGYGGVASLDPNERKGAEELGLKTADIAYGPLKKAWHKDTKYAPTLVLWNGSYGYDIATIGVKKMYDNLKESIASLCKYEEKLGGEMYFGIEPKPNEGHPCMLLPTVASALVLWNKLEKQYGVSKKKKGVNLEFGHSEMIGLDHLNDVVEQLDDDAMTHIHLNSQGYNDGIIYGGPGKYDIDHGVRINGMNIAIAGVMGEAGYSRWKGHDMQTRPYDNEEQSVDRVIRSILSWEACEHAARQIDNNELLRNLAARKTAKAEDIMRAAVVEAQQWFNEHYKNVI